MGETSEEHEEVWERGERIAAFTIPGEPAAKGNSRRLVIIRGRPALIKSDKGLAFEATAALYVPTLDRPFGGDAWMECRVFYASRRPDLDTSLVKDALQNRVLVNDRQVRHEVNSDFVDRDRPRVEVRVFKATPGLRRREAAA